MQYENCKNYVIPFIEDNIDLNTPKDILEIGCAEAGVLKAFTERGHKCVGIELSLSRVELAKQFMSEELGTGKISFHAKNIYDIDVKKDLGTKFDLIILKDVIEHIHDQQLFMSKIKDFLKPQGKIFFGFPPWQMPFGGHQQVFHSKILSVLPYFHMLPMPIYKGIMKLAGEPESSIKNMAEIKETGISLERFNRILKNENFRKDKVQLYLINPIYKYKFNLKPRKQLGLISNIPVLRNFITTCAYYLVSHNEKSQVN